MAGPPVYEDGLFELSIDPSQNSLDNTFKSDFQCKFKVLKTELGSQFSLLILIQPFQYVTQKILIFLFCVLKMYFNKFHHFLGVFSAMAITAATYTFLANCFHILSELQSSQSRGNFFYNLAQKFKNQEAHQIAMIISLLKSSLIL